MSDTRALLLSADVWVKDAGPSDEQQLAAGLIKDLAAKVVALNEEVKDFESSFDLYHKASMALMQAYKRAHPSVPENVWPSTIQVNEWAAGQLGSLPQEIQFLRRVAADYREGRYATWEIPSIIASCLENMAARKETVLLVCPDCGEPILPNQEVSIVCPIDKPSHKVHRRCGKLATAHGRVVQK